MRPPNEPEFLTFRNDISKVHDVVCKGIEDYDGVRKLLQQGGIRVPKGFRGIVLKLFALKVRSVNMTPLRIHKFLKSHYIRKETNLDEYYSKADKAELDALQSECHNLTQKLTNQKNDLLVTKAQLGYTLELFKREYDRLHILGMKNVSFKEILANVFNISESYGRKLRWLGKLVHRYPTVCHTSLSLHVLYKFKKPIDILFNNKRYVKYQLYYKRNGEPIYYDSTENSD